MSVASAALSVSADDGGGITLDLGGRGRFVLTITPERDGVAMLYLRWKDRPVGGQPMLSTAHENLAHARLDLRTGDVEPGWQA
jgi:hypothetical protein